MTGNPIEDVSDKPLNEMTVQELRIFRSRVDEAIRLKLAQQRVERERGSGTAAAPSQPSVDLERERDAWTARRARGM